MVLLTTSIAGLVKTACEMAVGVGLIFTFAAFAHCNTGCHPMPSPAEVDAAYRAEIVACSTQAPTREAARACRVAVNTRYGLCDRTTWPAITPCDELKE